MVEINRLKIQRFPDISYNEAPDSVPNRLIIDFDGYDSEEEIYEIVENDIDTEAYEVRQIEGNFVNVPAGANSNSETVNKVQEVLDQISQSVRQFMRERVESMERNIFRINNGVPLDVPNLQDIPLDVRMVAYLLAQGDNRHVEELLRTVHQNVIVNVNLSFYFKIMLIMLTFNTLLLFKWMVWDQLDGFP